MGGEIDCVEVFRLIYDDLILEMVRLYAGDPARIQHFIKVHSFAAMIGRAQGLGEREQHALETAAVVHDIAIKLCEEKYGSCAGRLQEKEGPALAREMLHSLGFDAETIERACYLVGHHHTYDNIDGMDYQILVEADFLVNLFEGGMSRDAAKGVMEKIFVTERGKELLREMFQI